MQKLTIEEVGLFVKNNSECILLSDKYINAKTKMSFKCKCGVTFLKTYNDFKNGQRQCYTCGRKNMKRKQSFTYEYVKEYIEKENYKLLSTQYINCKEKLIIKCDKGHEYKATFDDFKNNKRCKECFYEKLSVLKVLTYEYVKEYIESNSNCLMISTEYNGQNDVLTLKCGCGQQFTATFNKIKNRNKTQCNKCGAKLRSGDKNSQWKGGVTSLNHKMRTSTKYKEWRTKVFERDNFTCQCCRTHRGVLNAHHIKNFSDEVALRTSINNGITLCEECHSLQIAGGFHNLYGTKNNTEEQLKEYIEMKKSS